MIGALACGSPALRQEVEAGQINYKPMEGVERHSQELLGDAVFAELKSALYLQFQEELEIASARRLAEVTSTRSSVPASSALSSQAISTAEHDLLSTERRMLSYHSNSGCETLRCIDLTTGVANWRGAAETEPASHWVQPASGSWMGSKDASTCADALHAAPHTPHASVFCAPRRSCCISHPARGRALSTYILRVEFQLDALEEVRSGPLRLSPKYLKRPPIAPHMHVCLTNPALAVLLQWRNASLLAQVSCAALDVSIAADHTISLISLNGEPLTLPPHNSSVLTPLPYGAG